MPHLVAFHRGLNLGKRRVKMSVLASFFQELGLTKVATVLASGNVVFESDQTDLAALEQAIEQHLEGCLGYSVPTQLRTVGEIQTTINQAPFGDLFTDHKHASTQITFFRQPPTTTEAKRLQDLSTATDRLQVIGRELYWRCGTKLSESPLWTNAKANPHSDPAGTTRNLQTLQKILAKMTS